MTALAPCLDEWALATLDALAEQYARRHGDTGQATAARRADLLADLDRHRADHAAPHRPGGRAATGAERAA